MTLFIKNMVCDRCKLVISHELSKLGHIVLRADLGEVKLAADPSAVELAEIASLLATFGFELATDRKQRLVTQVKAQLMALLYTDAGGPALNLSAYLPAQLPFDYSYLSSVFSETEGYPIEKFFIAQKIERVKELISYGEETLSQIAFRMGYSSLAHLSSQFKKVSGLTPSAWKRQAELKRRPLDQLPRIDFLP
ncbi:AraC family transcriptional regulator [Pedobacter yulinensis]|uniref:AraC family transcriptional regulator n=1 Tax=Pedobacter yulinensis TaxID=2126353 RepID=A0A2T3HRR2_9SPHI|nr:AraC family transcriptional regulator [Pedobacter yulinensis]PST85106.1 AraC family transcriptional regulator [Pedobacter yulinensis]